MGFPEPSRKPATASWLRERTLVCPEPASLRFYRRSRSRVWGIQALSRRIHASRLSWCRLSRAPCAINAAVARPLGDDAVADLTTANANAFLRTWGAARGEAGDNDASVRSRRRATPVRCRGAGAASRSASGPRRRSCAGYSSGHTFRHEPPVSPVSRSGGSCPSLFRKGFALIPSH